MAVTEMMLRDEVEQHMARDGSEDQQRGSGCFPPRTMKSNSFQVQSSQMSPNATLVSGERVRI